MRRFQKIRRRFLSGLLFMGLATATVSANPTGATVRHGQVNITGGTQAQIQQLTDRAIIDWQSFSIGNNESVQFIQPSQLAVILNRVTGADPSEILGRLTANGNVFLINPNGILFGPNSTVNVGGLVASTLNITDQDFLAGNYRFLQDDARELAAVVNQGKIQITDAGYAVLLAPTVINEGTVIARAGNLVLASGEQATLNLDGRDLIHFSLNGEVSEGPVLLAPGMMSDAIAQTLGVAAHNRADKLIQMADGSVRMVNSSGTLVQAGTVSADGLDNTDAGSILLDSADVTILAAGSVTSASGQGQNSSAGQVLVLSDMKGDLPGLTSVENGARVAAAGGDTGDAGFIEVSGDIVRLQGEFDLSFTNGAHGNFLLDPSDVILVDETFLLPMPPMDGNSYVADDTIETMLGSMATVTIVSDGQAIISNISGSSMGADPGINAGTATGELVLTTAGAGTFIDLGVDQFLWDGALTLDAETDALLNSADVRLAGDFTVIAGGAITSNGLNVDTRNVAQVAGDGGSVIFQGASIDLNNSTIRFDRTGMGATLSLTATSGDIQVTDSLLESDFTVDPMFPALRIYESDFEANSVGGNDIIIDNTDVFARNITLTAGSDFRQLQGGMSPTILEATDSFTSSGSGFSASNIVAGDFIDISANTVDLQNSTLSSNRVFIDATFSGGLVDITDASITTDQRPGADPRIEIRADQDILGNSAASSGLHAATIILESATGSIETTIDTSNDGNPGDSIPTNLTVRSGGSVNIADIADPVNALGVKLTRDPNGGPGAPSISASNGDIFLSTPGKIGLGNGDGVSTGDAGGPLVIAGGTSSNVTLISADRIVDQNSTSAVPGGVEIQATGNIVLEAANGIGGFITNGQIDVETNNLTVKAVNSGAPINVVSNEDLAFIDLAFNGGEVFIQDTGGGVLEHGQVMGMGPNVLRMNQGGSTLLDGSVVRVLSLADTLVHDFDVLADQQVILTTANGASLLSGNNTGIANITLQDGGDGYVALRPEGNLGTVSDFLVMESDRILLGDADPSTNNYFLDLRAPSTDPISLEGAIPDLVTNPLDSIPAPSSATIDHSTGDIVLEVTGDLLFSGGVFTSGSLAIDAGTTGTVDVGGNSIDASETLLIEALIMVNGTANVFGTNVGLSFAQDFGTEVSPDDLAHVDNLVFGSTPSTSYFLRTNTEFGDAVTIVDSLSVQNKMITGNQVDTLHLENIPGDIIVDAPVDAADEVFLFGSDDLISSAPRPANVEINAAVTAGNRIKVQAENDIVQGTSGNGLLDAAAVVLDAGASIGVDSNGVGPVDQRISASALSATAGDSLYIRNIGPDLEIVSDVDVPVVGATNDFRVLSDLSDLTVSTDINASDIALVTGTDLSIAPQVTPADIILNNNITASGNLVVLASGNIVQNSGTLSATQLGLGSPNAVGSASNPISFSANNLAVFSTTNNLNPTSPPNPVGSVTSVGVTVNQGSPTSPPVNPPVTPPTEPPVNPEPLPDGSVVVEVVLQPTPVLGEEIDPAVFAQDNIGLVENDLKTLQDIEKLLDDIADPTIAPIGWWNDEELLKKKFRRKSR